MKILSINVARVSALFDPAVPAASVPSIMQPGGTPRVMTGIYKKPVAGPVIAKRLGMTGDEQADLSVHGGWDKAVYAYPAEHYRFWQEQRLRALRRDEALAPGAMGENLTIEGLLETDVWIGDRLRIGQALLEVTEPRSPCYKFGVRMGFPQAVKMMVQSGATGFYLKVLQEGAIEAGDAITLLPGPRNITVARINEQRRQGRQRDLF